ncbi:MAG: RIP metalloprotease RseP [Deltaproteobacteria bacterium]|nr:RIP metalloprotease RseP [Deltaproteobacteria bacterium]
MLTGILAAIVVLGVLIVVHEFGHFIVAKWAGVGVLKFSVGFGPKIFGRTVNGTEYAVSAVPLGGFVKMVGEDPDSTEPVDPRISFSHQNVWKRIAIVIAGPAFNLVFAFLAFTLVLAVYGQRVPTDSATVGGVMADRPAAKAGIAAGDTVTAFDGQPVATWDELSKAIRGSEGRTVVLTVQRNGAPVDLSVTPEAQPEKNIFGEVVGQAYVIGIERGFEQVSVGPIEAVANGAKQTAWWIGTLVMSVVKIFQGRISAQDIGGPILIVQAAGQQAQVGLESLLLFMAVISINLGILNLLPIPILDGGHLLFFLIEIVMRRPLDLRHREIAQQVGLVILIGLMAFAFYNDILRIVRGWG